MTCAEQFNARVDAYIARNHDAAPLAVLATMAAMIDQTTGLLIELQARNAEGDWYGIYFSDGSSVTVLDNAS